METVLRPGPPHHGGVMCWSHTVFTTGLVFFCFLLNIGQSATICSGFLEKKQTLWGCTHRPKLDKTDAFSTFEIFCSFKLEATASSMQLFKGNQLFKLIKSLHLHLKVALLFSFYSTYHKCDSQVFKNYLSNSFYHLYCQAQVVILEFTFTSTWVCIKVHFTWVQLQYSWLLTHHNKVTGLPLIPKIIYTTLQHNIVCIIKNAILHCKSPTCNIIIYTHNGSLNHNGGNQKMPNNFC